jgi:hypothetical protein
MGIEGQPALQGDYEVQLVANDNSGNELLCLVVQFTITPPQWANVLKSSE